MRYTKKTVSFLTLSVCAAGATAVALAASNNFRTAFADDGYEDEPVYITGSAENPAQAHAGVNEISYMVVDGNPEMGFAELTYYMSFTPANTGLYTFTHSNPDIGVGDIYGDYDYPYGEWNDDFTVYSVELTAEENYTVLVSNYDWSVDLTGYEAGAKYVLAQPETITVAYASAAQGSTSENALPYTVGDKIIVPEGHDDVWYTCTAEAGADYYLVAVSGSAKVYSKGRTTLKLEASATDNYDSLKGVNTLYICVTPAETGSAEVQILIKDKQTDGSCIVTAIGIDGTAQVGGGNWYNYTAAEDATAALSGEASVDVYEGYVYIGTLYNGLFVAASAEGESAATVALTAGKSYNFYAPAYEDEEGSAIVSSLEIVLG